MEIVAHQMQLCTDVPENVDLVANVLLIVDTAIVAEPQVLNRMIIAAPSPVEVSPVKSPGDFLTFCHLPRLLYSGQTGFACSLDAERWTLYAHWLNPHYHRVRSKAFLARRSGKVVGRIEAQIFTSVVPVGASPAQFGSLDAIDDPDVVAALMRTAENWLLREGADLIQGPFSPSFNSEAGLLVEGFQAEPMIFMPWHPPYLGRMLEDLGYAKIRDLISYRYDVDEGDRSTGATVVNRPEWRKRLRFRSFRIGESSSDARIVVDIFNDGWRENWGFTPLGLDEYTAMGHLLRHFVTQDYGFVIELDEEPVGFVIIVPNLHDLTADLGGRLLACGIFRLSKDHGSQISLGTPRLFRSASKTPSNRHGRRDHLGDGGRNEVALE